MAEDKSGPLLTYPGYRVAEALTKNIHAEHVGYDLSQSTGIRQGTLYPILSRWAQLGWLTIRDETPEEQAARPGRKGGLRRLVYVTELGREKIPDYYWRWQERGNA